jgi:pyridoxal phosphate enzyme (YggS family)
MSDVAQRLAAVQQRVTRSATDVARDPSQITLVAVGKTFPAGIVGEAVAAGATDLGENRVQEAVAKRPLVPDARWHLIGPLQRNKAKPALETFDVIHTLDRAELADRLQTLLVKHWPERRMPVLLEINVGDEPQKAGARPDEALDLLRHAIACDRLAVRGLMAIPPWGDDPEASRPYFRTLREVRDRLEQTAQIALPELSMGMSHDFEVAISEGATMVRVGTAIFGRRG